MTGIMKRYGILIATSSVDLVLSYAAPDVGLKSIRIARDSMIEMLLIVPPVFILLGLLDVWVKRDGCGSFRTTDFVAGFHAARSKAYVRE